MTEKTLKNLVLPKSHNLPSSTSQKLPPLKFAQNYPGQKNDQADKSQSGFPPVQSSSGSNVHNTSSSSSSTTTTTTTTIAKIQDFDDILLSGLDKLKQAQVGMDSITTLSTQNAVVQATIQKNMDLSKSKKRHGIEVVLLVSTVNPFQKKSVTGSGMVTSYMINGRIAPGSISEQDVKLKDMRVMTDKYGCPEIWVKENCNMSNKKKEEWSKTHSVSDLGGEPSISGGTSSNKTNKTMGQKQSPTKPKPSFNNLKRPAENRHPDLSHDDQAIKKRKIGENQHSSSSLAIVSVQGPKSSVTISDPDDSTTSSAILGTEGTFQGEQVTDANDTDPIEDVSTTNQPEHAHVYLASDLHGTPYQGRPVQMYIPLPTSRDVTFTIDENIPAPDKFSICKVEIYANPYVDKDDKYNIALPWAICEMKECTKIPPAKLFKIFENRLQKSIIKTNMAVYMEKVSQGGFQDKEEEDQYLKIHANQFWVVVGNNMTSQLPSTEAMSEKVSPKERFCSMELVRKFDTKDFSRLTVNSPKRPVGFLPYEFNCSQWAGRLTQENPTLMKFTLQFDVDWKHVSNTLRTNEAGRLKGKDSTFSGGAALGISSTEFWTNVVYCNYPSLKMILLLSEDIRSGYQNGLNFNRAKQGLDCVNEPYPTSVDRRTLKTFVVKANVFQGLILTNHSVKSFAIPISQEYILSPFLWGLHKKAPSYFEDTSIRDGDVSEEITCLSELKDCKAFLPKVISSFDHAYFAGNMFTAKLEPSKFNYYLAGNFCFKKGPAFTAYLVNKLTKREGPILVEGIRNILAPNGGNTKCFLSQPQANGNKTIGQHILNPGDGCGSDEQWTNLLNHYKVPLDNILRTIKMSDITLGGSSPSELKVVIWAIPVEHDDLDKLPHQKMMTQLLSSDLQKLAKDADMKKLPPGEDNDAMVLEEDALDKMDMSMFDSLSHLSGKYIDNPIDNPSQNLSSPLPPGNEEISHSKTGKDSDTSTNNADQFPMIDQPDPENAPSGNENGYASPNLPQNQEESNNVQLDHLDDGNDNNNDQPHNKLATFNNSQSGDVSLRDSTPNTPGEVDLF